MENKQQILAKRPVGVPGEDTWDFTTTSLPELEEGEMLVEQHYISLDPAAEVPGIGTFTVNTSDSNGRDYKFERNNSSGSKLSRSTVCPGGTGYGTPMTIKLISWTKINIRVPHSPT